MILRDSGATAVIKEAIVLLREERGLSFKAAQDHYYGLSDTSRDRLRLRAEARLAARRRASSGHPAYAPRSDYVGGPTASKARS